MLVGTVIETYESPLGMATPLSRTTNPNGTGYNCTTVGTPRCYGVGTIEGQKIHDLFNDLKRQINRLAISGFAPLALDGMIGTGTLVALKKIAKRIRLSPFAQGPDMDQIPDIVAAESFTSYEQIAKWAVELRSQIRALADGKIRPGVIDEGIVIHDDEMIPDTVPVPVKNPYGIDPNPKQPDPKTIIKNVMKDVLVDDPASKKRFWIAAAAVTGLVVVSGLVAWVALRSNKDAERQSASRKPSRPYSRRAAAM